MNRVILRGEPSGPGIQQEGKQGAAPASALVPPLVAFGLVLVGVGVVDLGFAWWPLRFGVGEWEFGTASRTFNSLALGTTGLVFLVVGASARRSRGWLRVLTVISVLGFLFVVGTFGLFALNAPVALRAVPAQGHSTLVRSIVRTTAFAVLYMVFFAWLSRYTWRRGSGAKGEP